MRSQACDNDNHDGAPRAVAGHQDTKTLVKNLVSYLQNTPIARKPAKRNQDSQDPSDSQEHGEGWTSRGPKRSKAVDSSASSSQDSSRGQQLPHIDELYSVILDDLFTNLDPAAIFGDDIHVKPLQDPQQQQQHANPGKRRAATTRAAAPSADGSEDEEGVSHSVEMPIAALPVVEPLLRVPPALQNKSSWEKMLLGATFTPEEEDAYYQELAAIIHKGGATGVAGYAAALHGMQTSQYLRVALELETRLLGLLQPICLEQLPTHLTQLSSQFIHALTLKIVVKDDIAWRHEILGLAVSQEQAFDVDPLTLFSQSCYFLFCVHVVRFCFLHRVVSQLASSLTAPKQAHLHYIDASPDAACLRMMDMAVLSTHVSNDLCK